MNKDLFILALERCVELGQEAKIILFELEKWRECPLPNTERTVLTVKHDAFLDEQRKWIDSIIEELEKED